MEKKFNEEQNNLKALFKAWGKPAQELKGRYDKTSVANFYIWASGKTCPPLKLLVDMAWETRTNIEYALGLTEVKEANDRNEINFRFPELLEESGHTYFSLAKKIDVAPATVKRYAEGNVQMRVETLLAIAEGLKVSLDYLLGLSDYRTWEEYRRVLEPFIGVRPGEAMFLSFPQSEMDGFVLMHPQGGRVVFPTGKMRNINDEIFKGVKVRRLVIDET